MAKTDPLSTSLQDPSGFVGAIIGTGIACESYLSGLVTYIHEFIGHIWLGGHLTRTYAPGHGPNFNADSINAFKALFHSRGIINFFQKLYDWQLGSHFKNSKGFSGHAHVNGGKINALGAHLGKDGLSAWDSISGSLPGLAINTGAAIAGVHLKEHSPTIGWGLISFALVGHLASSQYACDALFKNASTLRDMAAKGHDFANFAEKMGRITGLSSGVVATTTALFYVGIVPGTMLLAELRIRSQPRKLISDQTALAQIRHDANTDSRLRSELDFLTSKYCQDLQAQFPNQLDSYLIEYLPKQRLEHAKQVVLEHRSIGLPSLGGSSRLPIAAAVFSATSVTIALLAKTSLPQLSKLSNLLNALSPARWILGTIGPTKEALEDMRSQELPKAIKIISSFKATLILLSSLSLALAPGRCLYFASFSTMIAAPILLDFAKHRALKSALGEQLNVADRN